MTFQLAPKVIILTKPQNKPQKANVAVFGKIHQIFLRLLGNIVHSITKIWKAMVRDTAVVMEEVQTTMEIKLLEFVHIRGRMVRKFVHMCEVRREADQAVRGLQMEGVTKVKLRQIRTT